MKYLDLLSNQLILSDVLLDIRIKLNFQQDALAYYIIIIIRQYLEQIFNRI